MVKTNGDELTYHFRGAYNHEISLTLFPSAPAPAGHVVILAFYGDKLLFTKHKDRGLEWPGGKVEKGELPIAAAIRELYEETGGKAEAISFVGQYRVTPIRDTEVMSSSPEQAASPTTRGDFAVETEASKPFVKNIYVAKVQSIEPYHSGTDTSGYELLPLDIVPTAEEGYSPLVLDHVFEYVRRAIR